jgi:hypothetical protein
LGHFIQNLKRWYGFPSRRFHLRRPHQQNNREEVLRLTKAMIELPASAGHHRVINCDETAWKIVPDGLFAWARLGEDNVEVCVATFDKEAIIVLASVTSACEKLPLFMIAKGRPSRVERTGLGNVGGHHTSHSPSGWTAKETFHQCLEWL